MKLAKVTGTITAEAERVWSSPNGNPTYDIYLGGKAYRTSTDASCGRSAGNYHVGGRVALTLRAGRVIKIEEV